MRGAAELRREPPHHTHRIMSWISVTLAELHARKIAAIVDACSTVAKATAQPDRAAEIISGVVKRVRRKIASCAKNKLDEDVTKIPESLLDDTCKLILAGLKSAIEEALTEDEGKEISRINGDLNRIASGADVVDQPDTAETTPSAQSTANSPRITAKCRKFKRSDQDGV